MSTNGKIINKVYQRRVNNITGDCMQCAIATLFNKTYEEVPNFIELENWFDALHKFATTEGYEYRGMLHNPINKEGVVERYFIGTLDRWEGVNGLFYASVYSPKFFRPEQINTGEAVTHAVIIDKNYNIVHDPNPEYKDLKEYPMAKEIGFNGILHVTLLEKINEDSTDT